MGVVGRLVRNGQKLSSSYLLEPKSSQMRGGAGAECAIGQFSGLLLRVLDQFTQVVGRQFLRREQGQWNQRKKSDWLPLAVLVTDLAQDRVDRKRLGIDQQCVTIRVGFLQFHRGNDTASSGLVVHDDGAAQGDLKLLENGARGEVCPTARAKLVNDADRLGGKVVGHRGRAWECEQQRSNKNA